MKKPTIFFALLLAIACRLYAQPPAGIEYLGTIYHGWHSAWEIAINGRYAIVGTQVTGLSIVDISEPDNLLEIGWLDIGTEVWGVASRANLVYAGGLKIIDISNPRRPWLVGSTQEPLPVATDIYIEGELAYVACGWGLMIVDISDPREPVLIGRFNIGGWNYGIQVVDNLAFLTNGENGLYILDISNPQDIQMLSRFDTEGRTYGVTVVGESAFLADGGGGMKIVDVSDPTNPRLIGERFIEGGGVSGLTISGNYAYLLAGGNCRTVDITNQEHPVLMGSYEFQFPFGIFKIALSNNVGYVTTQWFGLRSVDLSDPENPVEIGEWNRCWTHSIGAVSITTRAEHAFVCSGSKGLRTVDLTNPLIPSEISLLQTPGWTTKIIFDQHYGYLADGTGGLGVLNAEDPRDTYMIGYCDSIGNVWDVAVKDDIGCVVLAGDGLGIIDFRDRTNPQMIGSYRTGYSPNNVEIYEDHAYLAVEELHYIENQPGEYVDSSKVHIVDISSPHEPFRIAILPLPAISDISIKDDLMYVASERRLYVYSLEDATHPQEVSRYEPCDRVIPFGEYAIIQGNGLQVLDTRDPADLRVTASYNRFGVASMIDAGDGFIFTGDDWNVYYLRLTDGNHVSFDPYITSSSLILSAFPNPFNSSTTITYSLPKPGIYAIDVVDIQGRLVAKLSDGWKEAGSYREVWDAGPAVSGIYTLRLQSENETATRMIYQIK